jgi:hypothetical protein
MKKTTERLLDDLLEDATTPEFQAMLLDKTLHSARRRKRARRFNMVAGALAVAGIFLVSFWKIREPAILLTQMRQPEPVVVNSQPLQPAQVVITKSTDIEEFVSAVPTYKEVLTSDLSGPDKKIDDQQSLDLLSESAPVLFHHGSDGHRTGRMATAIKPSAIKNPPRGFTAAGRPGNFDQRWARFDMKNTAGVASKGRHLPKPMPAKLRKAQPLRKLDSDEKKHI